MKVLLKFIGLLLVACLTACGAATQNGGDGAGSETTTGEPLDELRAIIPTTMAFGAPMVGFGEQGHLDQVANDVSVSNWDSVEQLKSGLIQGDAEVAATPAYVAANLHNKGIDVRLVGPVVWGMLFVMGPEGTEDARWDDLRGEKVAIPMPGNMPDLVFDHLLEENGMNKDDIEAVHTETGQQALALLTKGEVRWAVLPEHAATMAQLKAKQNGQVLARSIDLQQEWAKVTGGEARFPMAGLVMPGELVDANPELVAAVAAEVEAGIAKANAGDEEYVAKIAEHYDLPAPVVQKVLPRLQLEFQPASEARPEYEDFLTRIGSKDPSIYGGKLPGDDFYVSVA